ncbi:hypothetical protein IW137_005150, partial [Coemansia sp. RSA 1287]
MSSLLGGSQIVAAAADASDALVSMAGGGRTEIRHSRELYVLTRQRLAKWVVSRAHPERFMYSMDIVTALTQAAAQRLGMDVDVGVYDIATTRSGDVCVLAGLQGLQSGGREQLAVCILRSSRVSTEPDVVGLWPLRYAPDAELSQSGPSCPRLVLPEGGPSMFVVLRTAVIGLMVPTAGASFEEVISFRAEDSILGISTAPRFPYVQHESSESNLVLMCAGTGVLQVCIEVGKIISAVTSAGVDTGADADDGEIRTNSAAWPSLGTRIGKAPRASSPEREYQTQIEQAVFFRFGNDHNPLLFTIKSQATGVDSALETAALRVSQSILDNTSHFIVDRLDLGSHLNERLRRTRAVMQFIADSGLASKISRETR